MDHNELLNKLRDKLKELDNQIDQLQARADKATEKLRHQWEMRKIELRETRSQLTKQLDELREATESQWDELQKQFEKSRESVVKTLKDIKSQLFD